MIALALLLGLGGLNQLQAGTDTITVTVTVQVLNVAITEASYTGFGTLAEGSTTINPSTATVTNNGNVNMDFQLSAVDTTGDWTLATSPGSDICSVRALFLDAAATDLVANDFGTNDALSGTPTPPTADVFARTADAVGVKGYGVATTATRSMVIEFKAPTANTKPAAQTITITVTGAASA